ncbi:MAG: hypothetical protein NC355_03490 [Blautia sp.]|nr:hypothetical protein [Blautia sp.]
MICLAVSIGAAVGLGVFAAVLVAAGVGALVLRNKIRNFSRAAFGTDSLAEGLNRQADELAATPKSVSGMTRLMEPQIARDFPDFVWREFKHKAENMLTSALLAISSGNIDRLTDASEEVRRQVENVIAANQAASVREVYDDIRIHQTEIANYRKGGGKCVITIQSAVEYYHYKVSGDRVTEGLRERKEQTKYNLELLYIQDADAVGGSAVGTVCPNCGAPVRNLGRMVCEYCGSAVTPVNIKVWSLNKYYEVDYHHV